MTEREVRQRYKQMEQLWRDYKDNVLQQDLRDAKLNLYTPYQEEQDHNTGGGRSGRISAPTETIATRVVSDVSIQEKENTLTAIERVYNMMPTKYRQLIDLRYWNRYKQYTWDRVAMELGVSKRQAMRWRDQIMQATYESIND